MSYIKFFVISLFFVTLTASEFAQAKSNRSVQGILGLGGGALRVGADYEMKKKHDAGYGFYFRFYQEDEDAGKNGILSFGAFARPHFRKGPWDLFFTFGPGISQVQSLGNQSDETAIGGIWSVGLNFRAYNDISFGVENTKIFNLLNSDLPSTFGDEILFRVTLSI